MIYVVNEMEVLKRFKRSIYFVSIIYIIMGLIMLLNPSFVRDAVNYIIGIVAILYGLIYTISVYQKKETEFYSKFNLLGGILCISFGLFLILNPDVLISLIPFCAGVIMFMDAITFMFNSINLKRFNVNKWWISLVISIIFIAFSIFIMVNAKNITDLLIRFIGGFFVFDALTDIIFTIKLSKLKFSVSDSKEIKVIETDIKE